MEKKFILISKALRLFTIYGDRQTFPFKFSGDPNNGIKDCHLLVKESYSQPDKFLNVVEYLLIKGSPSWFFILGPRELKQFQTNKH